MVSTCLSLKKMKVLCNLNKKKFMKELETRFPKNNVVMNAEKSIAMSFHTTKKNRLPVRQQINFKCMDIACKSELRFLDVYITENLKWNTKVWLLSPKLSKVIFLIKLLKAGMSPRMIRSIYYANCQALLTYGIIFWGVDNGSNTIFKLQKGLFE